MVGTPGAGKTPALPGSASMPRKEEKKRKSSTSASRLSGRGLQGISVSGQRQLHVLCKREKDEKDFFFFFARIGRSDLTRKLEKVGPFECDELEKHCRVGAKCYPTKVPALYTMTKEKFKSVLLGLLLVSR